MKKITMIIATTMLVGCGSTVQPTIGSGSSKDETLNGATVDMFTFLRVQNNYGTTIRIDGSNNAKVTR